MTLMYGTKLGFLQKESGDAKVSKIKYSKTCGLVCFTKQRVCGDIRK
jgi:hypothetical protein